MMIYLQIFLKLTMKYLKQMYNEIFQLGDMSRSKRQAVISCLYKKGDREDITNGHPVSLLNYDNEI